MTRSSCLRKAPCLAPRAVFRLILLQKHVEAGCNPWRWEKESKGAGCFMELHGGGDSNPVGGSLTALSTGPAVCHAWHQGQLCPQHSPSEPEHVYNCRRMSISLSYLSYNYRHVSYKYYKVLQANDGQQQGHLFQDMAGHIHNLMPRAGTDSSGSGMWWPLYVPRERLRDDTVSSADS